MKDRFKKSLAGIALGLTLATALLTAAPQALASNVQFNDVNSNTSYVTAIFWAYDNGIIQGYGDGSFGPDNCVRRSELTKMIVEYIVTGSADIGVKGSDPNFWDVSSNDWFYPYVKEAKTQGIIQGYSDGSFRPNICVNRAEAMKIAVRALFPNENLNYNNSPLYYDDKLVNDIPTTAWFAPYARFMFGNRLIGTYHTLRDPASTSNFYIIDFLPGGDMTRKEVAQMLYLIDGYTNGVTPGTITLGTPSLYTPSNSAKYTAVSQTVNFTWSSTTGASYYDLMIRVPESSSYFVTQRAYTNSSSYDFKIYSNQGYYWKVRAYGNNGATWKDSSEYYLQFTSTGTSVGTPTLRLPASGMVLDNSTTGVNFQFLPTTGVSSYQLALKMPGNSDFGWWDITNTGLNSNGNIAYYFSKGTSGFLNTTGTYYWKVRAWNSDRTSYADSATWTMSYPGTTSQAYITLQNPASGSGYSYGDTVNFQWQESGIPSGGTHGVQLSCTNNSYPTTDHWLEWDTTSNSQYSLATSSNFTPSNTNGFSFTSDIYCHWRVVFYTTPGNPSSLSTTSDTRNIVFRISTALTTPVLNYPVSNASFYGSQTINFSWNAVPTATYYSLQMRNGNSSDYFFNQTTTSNTYTIYQNSGSGTTTYFWKITAYDNQGHSMASAERQFYMNP